MNLRSVQSRVTSRLMGTKIVRAIMSGQLSREQYRVYLQDVYCYARHSSPVIGLAAVRATHSHPKLAEYLFHHAQEELGHDLWAASDLRDLGMTDLEISKLKPSSACARMIGLEYFFAAHDNPVGLFGWMFVLETMGGKAGGEIASAISEVLGLGDKAMYFLRGHADADADHCEDLFEVISANLVDQSDWRDFEMMVDEAEELYCNLLDHAFDAGRELVSGARLAAV